MSRVIQNVASVRYEINARPASASMRALEEEAKTLKDAMADVDKKIAELGNVAPDDKRLIDFRQQLKGLKSDLDDVNRTMKDYTRGVKAADELLKAAETGTIESLSMKAIKSGANGLRKRIENIKPNTLSPEDQQSYRIIEQVIEEADNVVNKFKTDAAETIRILESGGTVSEKAMKQARDGVKSLMESYEEGSKENREFSQQYEYLAAKVVEFTEAQRRAKGEIVDANDARRAAVRLTREGAEAAAREREAQDAVITAQQKEIEQTRALRLEKEKEIEQTNSQMATNMRLADAAMAERRQMEDDYQASLGAIAAEKRQQAQQQAQAAHDEADQMRANAQIAQQTAQQKRQAYEQETQTVNRLDGEVKKLTEDLHALSAEPVKPKVDTSEIDALKQELQGIENELTQMGGMHTADMKAFNERLWRKQDKMKEMAAKYRETATDPDADFYNFGNKAKKIIKSFAAGGDDRRQDLMASIAERGGYLEKLKELESEHRAIVKQRTEYLRATDETGKHDWDEAIRQLDELDGLYASVINILKDYKQEFEKLKPADDAQVEKYDQLTERRAALLEKIASVEKQSAQAEKESATTSDELQRKQAELTAKTDELAQAKQRQAKAQGEMNTAQQQAAKAQDDANQKQVEAIQLGEKAAQAEREAATEQERHNEVLQRQDEKIAKLQNDYDALDDTLRKQEGELTAYDQKVAQSEQAIAEAERKKAQARELSAKDMRDAIAALRERNDAIGEANPEWEKNERLIAQYNQRLEEMKQRSQELRGEVMSLSDALGMAGTIDGGGASVEKMEQAIKTLTEAKRKATDQKDFDEYGAAIDKISQKLKEATSEWMSLSRAEEIARQAGENYYLSEGKSGFVASPEEIQKATQALERQRDALIKTIQTKKANKEATDAEEKELADLTKKLRDLKFEQDNVNMSQEKMRRLMEQPAQAVSLDELRAAIKRADGELRRMEGSLGKNSKEYKAFAEQVKVAKNTLKDMEGAAKAVNSQWAQAWSRLKTYVGMYMGFNMAWQKVTGTIGDVMTLSDKMGEVQKTTQMSADAVTHLSNELSKLDTRRTLVDLMDLAAMGGSLGLKSQEQLLGFTEAANQLTVALPEMGNEAARTLMKIADATGDLEKNGGDVRETLERVGSTIIDLRANSAAAAGPITDFISRVGAVGAQAGISIDQIAALGATVDALGGRVEMSATALSRMIPAIKNNAFEVAKAINITQKELEGKTGMEQMVTIFRKLHDSVKGFDTSTEEGMNAMADSVEKALGKSTSMQEVMKVLNQQGARAGIVFGLLSQNVDMLEKQLGIASNAYEKNEALMREYNNMNETAAAKWARLTNQIEEFFVTADATSWISTVIDALRGLADWVTDDGPIGRLTRYTLAYLGLMKAGWAESIGKAVLSAYEFIFATNQATAATAADTAATVADTAAKEAQAVASAEAAAAQEAHNRAMKANIITAVMMAVVALGWALYDYARKAKEAARQADLLDDISKKAKEDSIKERAELERLYKATQDQTKSIEERKKALHDMVGDAKYKEYYSKLNTESELATAAAEAYKELATQIIATARARALDAKAEELQRKRIALEDEKTEREQWRKDNQSEYDREKAKNDAAVSQQARMETEGAAGVGSKMGYVHARNTANTQVISRFQSNEQRMGRIDTEIGQIDSDLEKLKEQVKTINLGDGNGGGGGGGGNTPYGNYDKVKSPYSEWSGDDLVARRKEMLVRVRALANGADVQAVLSEDAKFISDAVRKNIKTTEQAIEWYNTERLKIQDALYAKHLTNTGDWKDPKKGAGNWRKMVQNDFDTYLRILDAYYTERKAHIEKAQAEEGLSEAEAQRLTIENETVWRKHRMELQQIYQGKSEQIAKEERDRIYAILAEQDEDSAEMVEKTIMKSIDKMKILEGKSEVEYRKIMSKLVKDIATDLYKQQNAVSKQMEAITAIIAKERPFNGLTENLQKNLSTMGILFADFDKIRKDAIAKGLEPEDDMKQRAEQTTKRMLLLLTEAENAYSLTWEQLREKMKQEGLGDWASALEADEQQKQAVIASLHSFYDSVQDAIKKEASQVKKQVDIAWNDAILPNGKSMKATYEAAISALGVEQSSVSRANNLIGAGVASERVADRLAIKQLQLQLRMQEHYYNLVRKTGQQRVDDLLREAKLREDEGKTNEAERLRLDAKHAQMSLNLSLAKEETELAKQREEIIARTEESQNRLYTELKEWADLLSSSLQSVFEASNAGNAEYYNERAKLDLTGKGGPGAGTYVVIDDAGTSDAKAHYEYLDERQALERQHEIERENAQAEAWKKLWDDINMKMSDQITDWLNASLQDAATRDNTDALNLDIDATKQNTEAVQGLTSQLAQGININTGDNGNAPADNGFGADKRAYLDSLSQSGQQGSKPVSFESTGDFATDKMMAQAAMSGIDPMTVVQSQIDADNLLTQTKLDNQKKISQGQKQSDNTIAQSTQATYSKMAAAMNMYGLAYQTMSNDNMDMTEKFLAFSLQAAGQVAIGMLTTDMYKTEAEGEVKLPGILGEAASQLGPIAGPIAFAAMTALLGGLMAMAMSKVTKAKSQISQVTGASVGAGRLATGMLTYAEGNVNELTDPASLTPGRQYNVDGADGRTYRARYMGKDAKTHITNGPEFHLVGEKGREAIIDAHTTRLMQTDDTGIWQAIQTLYNGGRVSGFSTRRGRGVRAFAEGNINDFEDISGSGMEGAEGFDDLTAMQDSLDRNTAVQEALLERLSQPIVAQNVWTGPEGIPNMVNKYQKEAKRHGVKYL